MLPANNYIAMKFDGKRLEDEDGYRMVLQRWMGPFPSIESAEKQCMLHYSRIENNEPGENTDHIDPTRIVSIVYKQCGDADVDSKVIRWENVPLGNDIIVNTTLYQVYHINMAMFKEYANFLRADYQKNDWRELHLHDVAAADAVVVTSERIPSDYLFYVCRYFDIDKTECEADPDYPWKSADGSLTTPPWNELLRLVQFAITHGHVHTNKIDDLVKQHHYLYHMGHFAIVQL